MSAVDLRRKKQSSRPSAEQVSNLLQRTAVERALGCARFGSTTKALRRFVRSDY